MFDASIKISLMAQAVNLEYFTPSWLAVDYSAWGLFGLAPLSTVGMVWIVGYIGSMGWANNPWNWLAVDFYCLRTLMRYCLFLRRDVRLSIVHASLYSVAAVFVVSIVLTPVTLCIGGPDLLGSNLDEHVP